jgi:hypothetical protein
MVSLCGACCLLPAGGNPVLLWVSDSGLGERTGEEDQSNPPYINHHHQWDSLSEEMEGGPQKKMHQVEDKGQVT